MKKKKAILNFGLATMTAGSAAVVGVVAACGTSSGSDQSDQVKIDGSSQKDILSALKLVPSKDSKIPTRPSDKITTVNGLENVIIKITKWKVDDSLGILTFTANISKEGLTAKDIDITTLWKKADSSTPEANQNQDASQSNENNPVVPSTVKQVTNNNAPVANTNVAPVSQTTNNNAPVANTNVAPVSQAANNNAPVANTNVVPVSQTIGTIQISNDSTNSLRPLWHVNGLTTIATQDELNKQLNQLQTLAHFSLPAGGYGVKPPRMLRITGAEGHATITPISDVSGLFTISMSKISIDSNGNQRIVDLPNIANAAVNNGDHVLLRVRAKDGSNVNGAKVGIFNYTVGGLSLGSQGQAQQVSGENNPSIINDGENGLLWGRLRSGQATLDDYKKIISLFKQGGIVQSKIGESLKNEIRSFKIPTSLGDRVHKAHNPMPNHVEAPFIDITTANSSVTNYDVTKYPYATLAFSQIASKSGWDESNWGGSTPMFDNGAAGETANTDYIGLINKIRDAGGDVALSFGGSGGKAFWEKADPIVAAAQLYNMVKEYKITRIDYDIETPGTQDQDALNVLSMATALVQQKIAADAVKDPQQWTSELQVQITAATDTDGMTPYAGLRSINTMLDNGVKIHSINAMAMMMKKTDAAGQPLPTLWDKVRSGVMTLEQQVASIYQKHGLNLTEEQIWSSLGFTFNISSDTWKGEIMSQADLDSMKTFAREKKLAFVGYWSINDDNADGVLGHGTPAGANNLYGSGVVQNTLHDTFDNIQDQPIQEVQLSNSNNLLAQKLNNYYGNTSNTKKTLVDAMNNAKTPAENRKSNAGVFLAHPDNIIIDISSVDGTKHMYRAKWEASKPPSQVTADNAVWEDLGSVPSDASINVALGIDNLKAKALADAHTSPFIYTYNEDGTKINSGVSNGFESYLWGHSSIELFMKDKAYIKDDIVNFDGALWKAKYWVNKSPSVDPAPWMKIADL
ncbi:MAG: glycosyl hydrolase family 18 protein [Mycoplasma sp.]|nr:glycosyl hydrolase family 18 protein [Mycoplasma sp.]